MGHRSLLQTAKVIPQSFKQSNNFVLLASKSHAALQTLISYNSIV